MRRHSNLQFLKRGGGGGIASPWVSLTVNLQLFIVLFISVCSQNMLCANHLSLHVPVHLSVTHLFKGSGEGRGGGRKSPDCFLALSLLFAVL